MLSKWTQHQNSLPVCHLLKSALSVLHMNFFVLHVIVAITLPELSFTNLCNIVYSTSRVRFMKHEMSLHLSRAEVCVCCQSTCCKSFPLGCRLLWVEPPEHLSELIMCTISNILLQIHTPRSY